MPRYLILVSPDWPAGPAESPAGLGRRTDQLLRWVEGLRASAQNLNGGRLETTSLRVQRDGTGGPQRGEAAPLRFGFIADLPSSTEARRFAESCPAARPGIVDVHELSDSVGPPAPDGATGRYP